MKKVCWGIRMQMYCCMRSKIAMLGAAGLGDIGKHFPDRDERYKGISSIKLLIEVKNMLRQKGYSVNNIDATIIAQAPRMAPYIDEMKILPMHFPFPSIV